MFGVVAVLATSERYLCDVQVDVDSYSDPSTGLVVRPSVLFKRSYPRGRRRRIVCIQHTVVLVCLCGVVSVVTVCVVFERDFVFCVVIHKSWRV